MKSKIMNIILCLIPFVVLAFLSRTIFQKLYLFEYLYLHKYFYLYLVVILLIIFNKSKLALTISVVNVVAIFLGQISGDMIRAYNISKITLETSNEQSALLHTHYGVPIYLFLLIIVSIISTLLIRRKNYVKA